MPEATIYWVLGIALIIAGVGGLVWAIITAIRDAIGRGLNL